MAWKKKPIDFSARRRNPGQKRSASRRRPGLTSPRARGPASACFAARDLQRRGACRRSVTRNAKGRLRWARGRGSSPCWSRPRPGRNAGIRPTPRQAVMVRLSMACNPRSAARACKRFNPCLDRGPGAFMHTPRASTRRNPPGTWQPCHGRTLGVPLISLS